MFSFPFILLRIGKKMVFVGFDKCVAADPTRTVGIKLSGKEEYNSLAGDKKRGKGLMRLWMGRY